MKYKYMHTLDGRPGHYYEGEQICFASRSRPIPLCDSLKQLHRQQSASNEWRKKRGFDDTSSKLGWVKVLV